MQNLFAVGTSPAPSRKPAGPSKQAPSSRFEDALEDARPKDAAADAAPPEPRPVGKSPEAKKTSSGNKPAGSSRSKRPTRRAERGKDTDASESSADNADPTATADGQARDSTDDGPEKKTPEQQAGDTQQPPIDAAQAVIATPTPVPTGQPAVKEKVQQKDTGVPQKDAGVPQKAAIQPLQSQGTKKQSTAAPAARPDAGKPTEGAPAARPDAGIPIQIDAMAAQSALADPSVPVQGIAPRVAKDPAAATAATDAAFAGAAAADIDLATPSSDSPVEVAAFEGGPEPTDAGDANGPAHAAARAFSDLLASAQGPDAAGAKADGPSVRTAAAQPPAPAPEAQFAEANHAQIVSGVHGQLLPNGGSMQLRLDPPELGALHVTVQMRDGVMTASFATPSDQAARLLTHSLGQLKTALESQGVSVEKLHVEQSPREPKSNGGEGRQPQDQGTADNPARQEQQRREMLRRMWRRLSGGQDPLDLVA